MVATLIQEQIGAKNLSSIRSSHYKRYAFNVTAGSTWAQNFADIGADLQTKFGTDYRVPAISGFIVASASVQVKFNAEDPETDEDMVEFDVSLMGNVWTFTRGELLVDKLNFRRPSSPSGTAVVQVFVCGSKYIQSET